MKYLSVKPLENGKREFMDLGSHLSPRPLQLFHHFFSSSVFMAYSLRLGHLGACSR